MSLTPSGVPLDDPFVADRLETVAKRLALLELMETQGIEAAVADSEDEWRTLPQPPEPDPELATFRENRSCQLKSLNDREMARLAHGALLNMKAQTGDDLSNEIRQVECPVLIIHGDADTTVPIAFGRALFKGIKRARLSVLNDQGTA